MDQHIEQLRVLGRAKWRLSVILTTLMCAAYFGFTLLVAYKKEFLGTLIVPGLSWGVLLGALLIVLAWFLTFAYVQWANRVYEPGLNRLRGEKK